MSTRRYADDEVREIFSLATTGGGTGNQPVPAESGGLTLAELRQIAQEAGIDPARVAHAAASLDARGTPAPVQRILGLPVGLSRVVDLPRSPTDREWEQLISACRSTFGVQGQVTSTGGLREWSNGSLHVCVEPTAHGEQLRIGTTNDGAVGIGGMAMAIGGFGVLMSAVVAMAGKPDKALIVLAMFGGMSLAAFATNAVLLPRWAKERQRQMESLAEHAVKLLSAP